jgi:hypothetical protein
VNDSRCVQYVNHTHIVNDDGSAIGCDGIDCARVSMIKTPAAKSLGSIVTMLVRRDVLMTGLTPCARPVGVSRYKITVSGPVVCRCDHAC